MKQPQSHTITHQKETRRHRLKRFLLILGILCALFLVLGASMIYFLLNQQELDESKLVMHRTSVMLDNEGQEVAKFFIENRNYLKIDETPLLVKKAFLAVEDRRFYQHNGIDGRGIIRALYRDILARSKVEGGSTITQQLVKNILLHREKSWLRKTEEIILATKLEKIYTKDEILEMYLNYIYFGHGAMGLMLLPRDILAKRFKN